MSSYITKFTHRTTGETVEVFAIDDYFGRHVYGYELPNGDVLHEDKFLQLYVRSDDSE